MNAFTLLVWQPSAADIHWSASRRGHSCLIPWYDEWNCALPNYEIVAILRLIVPYMTCCTKLTLSQTCRGFEECQRISEFCYHPLCALSCDEFRLNPSSFNPTGVIVWATNYNVLNLQHIGLINPFKVTFFDDCQA